MIPELTRLQATTDQSRATIYADRDELERATRNPEKASPLLVALMASVFLSELQISEFKEQFDLD